MSRTKSFILATIFASLSGGLAVPAADAHGAESETYTAEAAVPSPAQCRDGQEGISRESHPFQLPVSGRLSVTMTEFTGDWDLFLLDSTGQVITSSTAGQPPDPQIEALAATLGANDAVSIVACNFSGGPTASVSFTFVPAVLVSVGDVSVHEGDAGTRKAVFTVSLNQPSESTVTVPYATASSGAGAPDDYVATSGEVTFLPGSTSATVPVPVKGDIVQEGAESFSLSLSSPTGAIIGDGDGLGTIFDDDPVTGRRLAVGDVKVHEGDSGPRAAVFNVSLSKPSTSSVAVSFAVRPTATSSTSDFTVKSGTLTFAAGTTSQSIKVVVTPDDEGEIDESFFVKLSGASGATIATDIGVGIIVDDD